MAFGMSNNLIGTLNLLTFILSIPIVRIGLKLSKEAVTECDRFLDKPIMAIGIFLMVISLAGLIGACCRVSYLLWLYLVIMFLLIVLGNIFAIFAFVVTNKGVADALSGTGYKEYRLGDYSNWLQKRVTNEDNWNKIKSCLVNGDFCTDFHKKYLNESVQEFYREHLSAVQSGCCKPSYDCQFTYVGPTNWTKGKGVYKNNDCNLWDNNQSVLCFNCQSCKAGFVDNLRTSWKKVAIVNIIFLIILNIVYSVGCCAFRNVNRDNAYKYHRGFHQGYPPNNPYQYPPGYHPGYQPGWRP